MRRHLVALAVAGALLPGAGASAAPPNGDRSWPELGGAVARRDQGAVAALRRLEAGRTTSGIMFADGEPAQLGKGYALAVATPDVDADGDIELLQLRGSLAKRKLGLTEASDGRLLWSVEVGPFGARSVPGVDGDDVLLFAGDGVQKLDGRTGETLWKRSLSEDVAAYFGLSQAGDGYDFVLGEWSYPLPQVSQLRLEFRSLASGVPTGTLTIQGEGTLPTAALAGDLDGDKIGDVFTFAPVYTFSAAGSGLLRAHTQRGTALLWETAYAVPTYDDTWLVTATDATGDGVRDPVLLSEWLGADGSTPTLDHIGIVDGRGGGTAGLRPVASVELDHIAQVLTLPGDVDGDGGQDVVFSGAGLTSSEIVVVLEAIGKGGRIWKAMPGVPASFDNYGFAWWPEGGDLNGDGFQDAVVLLGDRSGPSRGVGISQRTGAQLWAREGLGGGFVVPTFADGDGDGGDDVLDRFAVSQPDFYTTEFAFTFARGTDLAPLWSRTIALDIGQTAGFISTRGGLFDQSGREAFALEFNPLFGRHYVEGIDAATGAARWTDNT